MNILYALIAFSVTMIVLTTLVIALVELVFELRGIRKRHMRYLIGAVFDEYLWPQFGAFVSAPEKPQHRADEGESGIENKFRQSMGSSSIFAKAGMLIGSAFDVRRSWNATSDTTQTWKNRPPSVLGILLWAGFAIASIVFIDGIFFFILAALLLIYLVDLSRERERDNFPLWYGLRPEEIEQVKILDDLEKQLSKEAPESSAWREAQEKKLAHLTEHPEARDLYNKITHRRQFVDEIVNVAKALAADPERAQSEKQNHLDVVDFASHLGRTQFGEAIRQISCAQVENAKEKADQILDKLLTEMARRFDNLSQGSTANYRDLARRWSVVLAFVVALIANVDAVHLFDAYVSNPDLAQKVTQQFEDRLEGMSQQEAELAEKLEELASKAKTNDKDTTDAKQIKEDIEELKEKIAAFQEQTKATLKELTDLGVPVGWEMFPWCSSATNIKVPQNKEDGWIYAHPDPRCKATVLAAVSTKRNQLLEEKKQIPDALQVRISFTGLLDQYKSAPPPPSSDTQTEAASKNAITTTDEGSEAEAASEEEAKTSSAHTQASSSWQEDLNMWITDRWTIITLTPFAAYDWVTQRWDHGLRGWLFGVLLAGLLIGLGGPFWFDIYKKLSALAQISNSLGLRAKQPQEGAETATSPETKHKPKGAIEAFKTAQDATTQVKHYKNVMEGFAFQARLTESAEEDEGLGGNGDQGATPPANAVG